MCAQRNAYTSCVHAAYQLIVLLCCCWCCVQADGGRLPACINAASLAFTDAGIAMSDMVVSCSAGHVDGQVCL
jgi:ribonuclease PH